MKTRRQFSREFKLQVIREVESGIPVAQVARQNQVHPTLVHKWKQQHRQDPENAFCGPGRPASQEAKTAELERTIGQLYMENAVLKKTLQRFEILLKQVRSGKGSV